MTINRAAMAAIFAQLSEREVETLTRMGRGETIAEIARSLKVADSSVSTYRRRVLTKFGMRTNAELVIVAYRMGLTQ